MENKERNSGLFSNDPEKDKKYYDEGRDGDYNTRKTSNTRIEEGDEDYDDEQERRKGHEEKKDESNSYVSYGGNSNDNSPE